MKLHVTLLVALTLALPLAAADQNVAAGPASVVTSNTESGDACGGDNGYHLRTASARVELFPGENVGASFDQYCADQTTEWYETHGTGFFLTVDHRVDNNAGPQVYIAYADNEMSGWRTCGLYVSIVGVPTQWGCLPAGTKVPMLPALP